MIGWPNSSTTRKAGLARRHSLLPLYAIATLAGWVLVGLYLTGTIGRTSSPPVVLQPSHALVAPPQALAPPGPSLASNEARSPTSETSIGFTFGDARPGVTFRCSLDAEPFGACTSPRVTTKLVSGPHSFRVIAVAGKRASPSTTYGWTVDLTPPAVTSVKRTGMSPTNAASVFWSVTFDEPVTGVDGHDFALAGTGAASASISSVSGSGASYIVAASSGRDGTLSLSLTGRGAIEDAAGNSLATAFDARQPYTIDRTPPPPPLITSSTDISFTSADVATLRLTDAAGGVTFLCSMDGATLQPCPSTVRYRNLRAGPHSLQAEAMDEVGNVSGVAPYSWTVLTTQPVQQPQPTQAQAATQRQPAKPTRETPPAKPAKPANIVEPAQSSSHGQDAGLSIEGNAIAPIYPGGPAVPVDLVITNSSGTPKKVTSVIARVAGTSGEGCAPAWFSFRRSLSATVTIPAGQTRSLAKLGVPKSRWPRLAMKNTDTEQDSCKGATVSLSYTGRATP